MVFHVLRWVASSGVRSILALSSAELMMLGAGTLSWRSGFWGPRATHWGAFFRCRGNGHRGVGCHYSPAVASYWARVYMMYTAHSIVCCRRYVVIVSAAPYVSTTLDVGIGYCRCLYGTAWTVLAFASMRVIESSSTIHGLWLGRTPSLSLSGGCICRPVCCALPLLWGARFSTKTLGTHSWEASSLCAMA